MASSWQDHCFTFVSGDLLLQICCQTSEDTLQWLAVLQSLISGAYFHESEQSEQAGGPEVTVDLGISVGILVDGVNVAGSPWKLPNGVLHVAPSKVPRVVPNSREEKEMNAPHGSPHVLAHQLLMQDQMSPVSGDVMNSAQEHEMHSHQRRYPHRAPSAEFQPPAHVRGTFAVRAAT